MTEQDAAPRLADRELAAEIELYGELVAAASASDGPLTLAQIDRLLGVPHKQPT